MVSIVCIHHRAGPNLQYVIEVFQPANSIFRINKLENYNGIIVFQLVNSKNRIGRWKYFYDIL